MSFELLFGRQRKVEKEHFEQLILSSPKRCRLRDSYGIHSFPGQFNGDGAFYLSVPFHETFGEFIYQEIGVSISAWKNGKYGAILDDWSVRAAETFKNSFIDVVFLKSKLDTCVALDYYRNSADRSGVGALVHSIKFSGLHSNIDRLAALYEEFVNKASIYEKTDCVVCVPSSPNKPDPYLRRIASYLSDVTGKENLSKYIGFNHDKVELKSVSLAEKWDALEKASPFCDLDFSGKRVLLIDDLYESGCTMHFWAGQLYSAGATHVHGVNAVKTWSDTDNL